MSININFLDELAPGTKPHVITGESMGANLAQDPDWMFVYREHRHNDRFVAVHVPTGTRIQIKLSPEHAATAEATRKAEREGGYGTKLSFGDTGQKRYRCVLPGIARIPDWAADDLSYVPELERLGAVEIRQETYEPFANGSGTTPDNWVEVSFMADEKAFDRIFGSGQFPGIELVE